MPAIPTKLFDVRQGNNSIDSDGTVYPRAALIVYKDNAAKSAIEDAFATMRGYQATIPDPANPSNTIPNPQSKQQFFHKSIEQFIRDTYRASKVVAAVNTAKATAETAADAELPRSLN